MERKIVISSLLVFLVACSQNGFQTPLASVVNAPTTPTAKIQQPYYSYKVGKGTVVEGLVRSNDLKLNIDGKSTETSVKGNVTVRFVEGDELTVPVDVSGKIVQDAKDGSIGRLQSLNNDSLTAKNLRVAATLTCIDDTCEDSFIDIYVTRGEFIYRLQVEAYKNTISDFTKGNYPTEEGSDEEAEVESGNDKKDSVKGNTPKKPATPPRTKEEEEESAEFEHDEGPVEGAENGGSFVGNPVRDVEVNFPDLAEAKPEGPKKQEPKKDESKSDNKDDKKDENKEEPKKDDTKKDENKSDSNQDSDDGGIVDTVIRKLNQVVTSLKRDSRGRPQFTKGHLENATDIYAFQQKNPNAGFRFIRVSRGTHYGSEDMLAALIQIGQFNKSQVKGYVNNVADISYQKGGQLGRHKSHQLGIDADISYYFEDKSMQKGLDEAVSSKSNKLAPSFMAEEQWDLFKSLVNKNIVTYLFVDPVIKKELCSVAKRKGELNEGDSNNLAFQTLRLMNTKFAGHHNHYHLRLKCSQAQPRCRQEPLPSGKVSGC